MNQGAMPAYPVNTGNEHVGRQTSANTWQFVGMSKREVFAMAAMQGMGACMEWDGAYSKIGRDHGLPEAGAKWVAIAAVRYADALLAALSDQPTRQENTR